MSDSTTPLTPGQKEILAEIPECSVNVLEIAVSPEQRLADLEAVLPVLSKIGRIAEKMYQWQLVHGGQIPPIAWEELRVALMLPPPAEPSRIIKSTILPASPRKKR